MFTQYLQQSKFIEGSMIYNNTEFYVQDNWKVNSRLTLDYGVRFTHQQPQYDQFLQMSNFFPNQWSRPATRRCSTCRAAATARPSARATRRNAMDPRTGQILTAPGAANTQAAIGTPIPGTGNRDQRHHPGRQRHREVPATPGRRSSSAPRFGCAYDLTGNQKCVIRGGGGLFYDRPDGNTVFSIPGNPPISTLEDLRNGQLQTLGAGA